MRTIEKIRGGGLQMALTVALLAACTVNATVLFARL
jgi:hypothetical protein